MAIWLCVWVWVLYAGRTTLILTLYSGGAIVTFTRSRGIFMVMILLQVESMDKRVLKKIGYRSIFYFYNLSYF